nr:nucleoside diphosphate kinase regulator [uncultured Devosia sp.]
MSKVRSLADHILSPKITLCTTDHQTLVRLAMAGVGHTADDADELLYELERATVVPESKLPLDVVRMGSLVSFRAGDETKTVQLVYPKDADISQGKISVLTPVGAALIGLRAGQSITWRTRGDRRQALTVLLVSQNDFERPQPPSAA